MDINEALNTMCERCYNHEVCMGTGCEPKRILAKAAEKQIPHNIAGFQGTCICGKKVFKHMDYCNSCGQKLNWVKEEP